MRAWGMALWLCAVGCSYKTQGPGPAPAAELPPEVKASLPQDRQGRPILGKTRASGDGNLSIVLFYDEKLDDPITRWGACVERVVACKKANAGHPIKDCVPLIARCADDTGGVGCCPGACVDAFAQTLAHGVDETEALRQTFFKGDCVAGLTAFLAADPVQP